jgi:amino acid transporter
MAAASRLMFSLSRDRMLPGSARLARVSPRTQSPSGSLVTVAALSVVLVTVGTYIANQVMALIVGMASVGYYAVYALTIAAVLWASRNGRLSSESTFDLGRAAVPVRWAALVWSVFVVGVLTVPESNRKTALMAAAFFAIAALWYFAKLRGDLDRGVAGVPRVPSAAQAPSGQGVVSAPVAEEA